MNPTAPHAPDANVSLNTFAATATPSVTRVCEGVCVCVCVCVCLCFCVFACVDGCDARQGPLSEAPPAGTMPSRTSVYTATPRRTTHSHARTHARTHTRMGAVSNRRLQPEIECDNPCQTASACAGLRVNRNHQPIVSRAPLDCGHISAGTGDALAAACRGHARANRPKRRCHVARRRARRGQCLLARLGSAQPPVACHTHGVAPLETHAAQSTKHRLGRRCAAACRDGRHAAPNAA